MEKSKVLYKLSKTGSILRFEVIARSIEDGAVLITRKGVLGGATQEDIDPQYPKNVGRANETSPWAQSLVMFNSKVNKLLDRGYKEVEAESLTELRALLEGHSGTDGLGNLLPMLAQKDPNKVRFPGLLQPKLDGVRCLAYHGPEGVILRSRRGKEFPYLQHINKTLKRSLPKGWYLDGELYLHGKSLQQIVSMVKREQEANASIMFRAFDCIPGKLSVPFKTRLKYMISVVNASDESIDEVDTHEVYDHEGITAYFSAYKDMGYEGVMWRDPEGFYEAGTRSWGLIKVKDFMEDEFVITGVTEATGRDSGTALFECITHDESQTFTVRPMGSRALRARYLQEASSLIGEKLTVRFQNYTDDGVPFHLRGVCIRNYE